MKKIFLIGSLILIAPYHSYSSNIKVENVGGGDVCSSVNSEIKSEAESLTKKYQEKITLRTNEYKKRAKLIEDDAPKPDTIEAGIGIDIEVTSHNQDFSLDIPEVTIKEQRMSMDLPQITMRRKDMSFDNPTLVMRNHCSDGLPEVVCENGGYHDDFGIWWPTVDCRTRPGAPICIDTPEMEMRRIDWSMDVPETTMTKTEWIMGVPEFKMVTQKIVLTIPDFTVKNISAEMTKVADAGNQLGTEASNEMAALTKSMREEISANSAKGISNSFNCQRTALRNKINDALSSIDSNLNVVTSALENARAHNATDLAASMEQAQQKLIDVRAEVQKKLNSELERMNAAEREAIAKVVSSNLGELKV